VAQVEQWRLVPWWVGPAGEALAAGEYLLEQASRTAAVQLYGFAPEALVLGPRQRDAGAVDWPACQARRIGVYLRRSGGSAVLGDRYLLNMDVALPPGHPLALTDLTRSYAWLGNALATALSGLGVPATALTPAAVRAAADERGGSFGAAGAACFGGLSPYEVVAGERKVVGLSQVRRRQGALLQVGIPLRWDAAGLAALLAGSPLWKATLAAELADSAAGLGDWGLAVTDAQAVLGALLDAVAHAAGVRFDERPFEPDERAAISSLAARDYPRLDRPLP